MEEYSTTDQAMAVYLTINGHSHQRLERKGRKCAWVFHIVGNLISLVDSYFGESSEVDVQECIRVAGDLRSEMYDFMKGARA